MKTYKFIKIWNKICIYVRIRCFASERRQGRRHGRRRNECWKCWLFHTQLPELSCWLMLVWLGDNEKLKSEKVQKHFWMNPKKLLCMHAHPHKHKSINHNRFVVDLYTFCCYFSVCCLHFLNYAIFTGTIRFFAEIPYSHSFALYCHTREFNWGFCPDFDGKFIFKQFIVQSI